MIRYNGDPTPKIISKLIEQHDVKKYERLQNYYEGRNDILSRVKKDTTKPNNHLVSGYPSYIVDTMQGYFIGRPVNYTSENEELMESLQEVFNSNDEQDENSELVKMAGIKGKAYEIVYMNEDSQVSFNEVNADNIIMVYDTKIKPSVNFAIKYHLFPDIETDKDVLHVEVYTKENIINYKQGAEGLIEEEVTPHIFSQVPVIEFMNNDEGLGDFERVLTLIDAYDLTQADTANDFEEFTDAFLVLAGMMGTDKDDVEELRENRIILTDGEGQSAYWLIKDINDAALENYKNRLQSDIHKFSKVPDMSDKICPAA